MSSLKTRSINLAKELDKSIKRNKQEEIDKEIKRKKEIRDNYIEVSSDAKRLGKSIVKKSKSTINSIGNTSRNIKSGKSTVKSELKDLLNKKRLEKKKVLAEIKRTKEKISKGTATISEKLNLKMLISKNKTLKLVIATTIAQIASASVGAAGLAVGLSGVEKLAIAKSTLSNGTRYGNKRIENKVNQGKRLSGIQRYRYNKIK